jgi:malate dehydrogenase (oxaloacetate-decarboxylating)
VFPGVFRGALDVRARTISDRMAIAAAQELVAIARGKGLAVDRLLPTMDDWQLGVRVAVATGMAAIEERIARRPLQRSELEKMAIEAISIARQTHDCLVGAELI